MDQNQVPMKMIDYQVVVVHPDNKEIKGYIDQGYILYGQPVLFTNSDEAWDDKIVQAVIKVEPAPIPESVYSK